MFFYFLIPESHIEIEQLRTEETYKQVQVNDETKAFKAFKKCTDIIENSGFDKSEKQNLKLLSKTKVLADFAKR